MPKGPKNPDDVLPEVLEDLKRIFKDDLISATLHGSAAGGEYRPGLSDLNLLVVVTPAGLAALDRNDVRNGRNGEADPRSRQEAHRQHEGGVRQALWLLGEEYSAIADHVDASLKNVYDEIARTGMKGKGNILQRLMRRNRVDWNVFRPAEAGGLSTERRHALEAVARNYYDMMGRAGELIPGCAWARDARFNLSTIRKMMAGDSEATRRIVDTLEGHTDRVFKLYYDSHMSALAKDVLALGFVSSATAVMSSPMLFSDYLKRPGEIHPGALVSHFIFSALSARHPYYADNASTWMAARGGDLAPSCLEGPSQSYQESPGGTWASR